MKASPKIVTIGGGTGQFTILSGLKNLEYRNISAIVNMVDDGGSTGVLRDELGALPPGDVRQCLVALSKSDKLMRDLFNYRFEKGELAGHNFGNLFITALEKITGSFEQAIAEVAEVLAIDGEVIPATVTDTRLCLKMKDGSLIKGQHKIDNSFFVENKDFEKIFLRPEAVLNPRAKKAIKEADIIIVGPGSFYTSIVPNLLVSGISEELSGSKAIKIFICNLVNKPGQTDNFRVDNYLTTIEDIVGAQIFDWVIYNNKVPSTALLKKYEEEGENLVHFDPREMEKFKVSIVGEDLINREVPKRLKQDRLKRNLIRHNSSRIAELIRGIYEKQV